GGDVRAGQPSPISDPGTASLGFYGTSLVRSTIPIYVGPNFTIEAWVKADAGTGGGTIVSLNDGVESRTLFQDGARFTGMMDLTSAWPNYSVVSTEVDPTLWHHV